MSRQINHKSMRVVVGVIALSLAPVVYLLSGTQEGLSSISISYWTDSRDVFVGSLIAVGFFLFAYNGTGNKRDLEFYLSKASCCFAICVALFPTLDFAGQSRGPQWIVGLAEVFGLLPHHVHYGAAILLFICLIAMMWFFSARAMRKGKPWRSFVYRAISLMMLGGILAICALGFTFGWDKTVLVVEIWGLTLFGLGWLIAGTYKTEPGTDDF